MFKRKKEAPQPIVTGCDPDHFADEISTFLQRAAEKKAEGVAALQSRVDQLEYQVQSSRQPDAQPETARAPEPDTTQPSADSEPASSWSSPFEWRKSPESQSQVPSPKSQVPSPKSQVPSPKSQVPSPKAQVPGPKSQVPGPESKVPGPKSQVPGPVQGPESIVSSHEAYVPSPESFTASNAEPIGLGTVAKIAIRTWDGLRTWDLGLATLP